MPNYKISVIVPIYKVEDYMQKCIDSILNQSYKNLEIILVDDGSPDNCPKICDEYAVKDERIKVIHKKNGGLASARNAGLKICTGEYISFVDSDDWIEPTMLADLLDVCLNHNCDCVGFSARMDVDSSNKVDLGYSTKIRGGASGKIKIITLNEYFTDFLNGDKLITAWSRLCKREVCIGVEFPENRVVCEDGFAALPTFENAKKIAFLEKPLYHYIQRKNSLTFSKITVAKLKCFLDLYHYWFIYSKKHGRVFDKGIRKKYYGLFEKATRLIGIPVPYKLFALIPLDLVRFVINILDKV